MNKKWHAIVVDDQQGEQTKELLESSNWIPKGDSLHVTIFENFDSAIDEIGRRSFDFLVLDLKDQSNNLLPEEEDLRGKDVFELIRKTKFTPIVFFTAFPRRVGVDETTFIKIVDRTDVDGLEDALKDIFSTKLVQLSRLIEEEKRDFMWDFVEENWSDIKGDSGLEGELAHMLARRLSDILKKSAINFLNNSSGGDTKECVHPVEMYIIPPTNFPPMQATDLVKEEDGCFYLVLTPTCDFVPHNGRTKADFVLRAKCLSVHDEPEFTNIKEKTQAGDTITSSLKKDLERLIRNSRKGQAARYFFLPAIANLFPELVVDFQQLSYVSIENYNPERVASLDSPYSELIIQRLSAFLGRIGTPDLDVPLVRDRIIKSAS